MLYGRDNPIDGVVLDVLLKKAKEIRRNTGYTVSFPEDSETIMDAVLTAVLIKPSAAVHAMDQLEMDFGELSAVSDKRRAVEEAYDRAVSREKATRSVFAQYAIKAEEIEKDLKESDEVIGDLAAVEQFFINAMDYFGAQCSRQKEGCRVFSTNLPDSLRQLLFANGNEIHVSFKSPTPEGYKYIGRNHPFIEQLCQILMAESLAQAKTHKPARASVIRTKDVKAKTTLIQFRVRNVIEEYLKENQLVAEEMLLWGYEGTPRDRSFLSYEKAKELLIRVRASVNISPEEQSQWLEDEQKTIDSFGPTFDGIAKDRANHLVMAHERFRKVVGGTRYRAVEPVLPMDIMGVYILIPEITR